MNLGELLDRVYDVLGDLKADPQVYQRDRLVTLTNEALVVLRRYVEDTWFVHKERLVATQAVYTFPASSMRALMIAYQDEMIDPKSLLELRDLDTFWETRTGPDPQYWTSDGEAHNKYRLYPIPTISTADDVFMLPDPNVAGWTANKGVVGRWQDDGVDIAFSADPNVVGWNAEHGRVYRKTSDIFSDPHGRIGRIQGIGAGDLTLWLVEVPTSVSVDNDTLPLKEAFAGALIWYVLWQMYEEEGDHHNPVLAPYYRDLFTWEIEQYREQMRNPMPYQIHKLRSGGSDFVDMDVAFPFAKTAVIDGQTVHFGWPKREVY